MWILCISISGGIAATLIVAHTLYRKSTHHTHCMANNDVVVSISSHPHTPTTFTPSTIPYRQDWTAWQLHTSISLYLNTMDSQLTIEQQRRLEFIAFLMETGRMSEFIDVTEAEV